MNPLETTVIILGSVAVSLLIGLILAVCFFAMRKQADRLELDIRDLQKTINQQEKRIDRLEINEGRKP